jgi:hypothetical protein
VKTHHYNMLILTVHWLVFYAAIHGAIWIAGLGISRRGELILAVGSAFVLLIQLRRILAVGRAESQLRATARKEELASLPFVIESKGIPIFSRHLLVILVLMAVLGFTTRLLRTT